MVQAVLVPSKHEFDPAWNGGDGPQCDGAADVKVVCRPVSVHSHFDSKWECAMRKPEPGSALSEAAQRAFDSLDLRPNGAEV